MSTMVRKKSRTPKGQANDKIFTEEQPVVYATKVVLHR